MIVIVITVIGVSSIMYYLPVRNCNTVETIAVVEKNSLQFMSSIITRILAIFGGADAR